MGKKKSTQNLLNRQKMGQKHFFTTALILILLGGTVSLARAQNSSILTNLRSGKKSDAISAFEKLEKARQIDENQMLALSDSLEALGQVPLALDFLDVWRADHPFSRRIEERLAQLALEANQLERAISAYRALTQKFPKNRDYWLQLGKIDLWAEKQKEAIHAYKKALALDPKDVATLRKLAQLYSWTNQDGKAYAVQSQILKVKPGDVALWKKHGIQARWLGKNDEAIEAFKNVLLRDPKDAEAFFLLGETYLWTNQQDKARLCFRETLKLNPGNVKARFYWAQIRQWEPFGWWEAKKDYQMVLKAQPGNQEVRKYLAQIRQVYGPLASGNSQYIHDSNDLKRLDLQAHGEAYVSARLQLRGNGLFNRLEENKPTGHFAVSGEGVKLGALWNVLEGTRFLGLGGLIAYNGGESFPLVEVQWQQRLFDRPNWPGQFYSTVSYIHDQVLDGVLAIKDKYIAHRGKWSLYWQPDSAFHAGSDFLHSWYSDGNQKTQLYATAEFRFWHLPPFDFFFTALFAYENSSKIYPNAMPYWTPRDFKTYAAGPAIKWQAVPTLWLRSDVTLAHQTGNGLAINYKIWLDWRPNAYTIGTLTFQSYGSRYYSYKAARLSFSYRF